MATIRTQQMIRAEISRVTDSYRHVLDCGPASIDVNAPRALMQLAAVERLDALYFALNEVRPRFACDDKTKRNQ